MTFDHVPFTTLSALRHITIADFVMHCASRYVSVTADSHVSVVVCAG